MYQFKAYITQLTFLIVCQGLHSSTAGGGSGGLKRKRGGASEAPAVAEAVMPANFVAEQKERREKNRVAAQKCRCAM